MARPMPATLRSPAAAAASPTLAGATPRIVRMPSSSMMRISTGRSRWADISPSADASEFIDTSIMFPPTPDNFGTRGGTSACSGFAGASSGAAANPGLKQFAPAPAALTAPGAGPSGTAPQMVQVPNGQMVQMAPQMQGIQMMQLPNGQMVQVVQVPAGQAMPGGMMPMGQVMMPSGQGLAPGVQMAPMMMPMQPAMAGAPQGVPLQMAPQPMAPQQLAQQTAQLAQQPVAAPYSAPPMSPPLGHLVPTSPTSPPPAGNADDEPYRHEVEQRPEAVHKWSAGRQLFSEAIDANTVDDLSHDGQPMASGGSALHGTGRCSPCAWFWKARGCQNGGVCDYCHLCPEGELKNRKKQKVAQIRQTAQEAAVEAPVAELRSLNLSNLL